LLSEVNVELTESLDRSHCIFRRPTAIGVHSQFDLRANYFSDSSNTSNIAIGIDAHFYFSGFKAFADRPSRNLCRFVRFNS
jgi:hypothetical protein